MVAQSGPRVGDAPSGSSAPRCWAGPVASCEDLRLALLVEALFTFGSTAPRRGLHPPWWQREWTGGLVSRDRTCVVPGCRVDVGLEIDHVQAFHLGGPTELDNLALLCHRRHHRIETYDHWILQCLGTGSEGEP